VTKALNGLKKYELDDDEWKIVADLVAVLSVGLACHILYFFISLISIHQQYKKATLFFSQDSATIAAVIPAMDKLDSKLNQQTKEAYHPAVISAMQLAKNKMDRYWKITRHWLIIFIKSYILA
jgi:hypothetical protein